MRSVAKTVSEYLEELPEDRRKAIEAVRNVILKNLPEGVKEGMQYGMIGYCIPLKIYPTGYLGQKDVPLPFAALASQKNYMAIYMMSIYGGQDEWFRKEYESTGKKLNMGKSCVRFKKIEDLPLDLIGNAIGKISVKEFIENYEKARK